MIVTVNQHMEVIWIVCIASLIDVILTNYLMWVDRSVYKNKLQFSELNAVADFIMKKSDYGPLGLLFGALFSQSIIWGVFIIFAKIDLGETLMIINFLFGALFIVIWTHIFNIKSMNKWKEVIEWKKQLKLKRIKL